MTVALIKIIVEACFIGFARVHIKVLVCLSDDVYLVVPVPHVPPQGVHGLVTVVPAPGHSEGRPHPAHRRAPLPLLRTRNNEENGALNFYKVLQLFGLSASVRRGKQNALSKTNFNGSKRMMH